MEGLADLEVRLDRLKTRTAELRARTDSALLPHLEWLPAQDSWLRSTARRKLLRAGNQSQGKTIAGLSEVIFRCLGRHPYYRVKRPPVTCWVVTASWSQSIEIQAKLWALVPKHELAPDCLYDEVNGFGTKSPTIRFRNGSKIRIKTTGQRGLSLSSATIDFVLFDEPPLSPRIYAEVCKRVLRTGGRVGMTLTPINAPVEYLKEETLDPGDGLPPVIEDHHFRLEAKNLIPVGRSRPLQIENDEGELVDCDQSWIDQTIRETLPMERPVVCHGEWELRFEGRAFEAFYELKHCDLAPPRGECKLTLGIDHGDGVDFSQCAVLLAVNESRKWPMVWAIDEYVSDGSTTPDMDAGAIVEMLQRSKLPWKSLDFVYGDRRWGGRKGAISRKSNRELQGEIAVYFGMSRDKLKPMIKTVKRGTGHGKGSVMRGLRFMHYAMVRPGHWHVSPRCTRLIEALNRWTGLDDQYKHIIDAVRYGLDPWIFPKRAWTPRRLRAAP